MEFWYTRQCGWALKIFAHSGRSQAQRTVCCMIPFIGNIQKRPVHRDRRNSGCLGLGDNYIDKVLWNHIVATVAQLCECIKNHKIIHLKVWILWHLSFISETIKRGWVIASTACLQHPHSPLVPPRFAGVLGSPLHLISTSAVNEANWFNQLGYIWVVFGWKGWKIKIYFLYLTIKY